jgi:hypothetical protein
MTDQLPSNGVGEIRRIALPKNIAETLKYHDDLDLEALRVSVENELQRRRLDRAVEARAPAETGTPFDKAPVPSVGSAKKQRASSLPVGKASLIRASFESGMKPQAIARTLRISVAQVNEVLAAKAKWKR